MYNDVESEDPTTKLGNKYPMFRKKNMCKVFKWKSGMQFTSMKDFKEGIMEFSVLNNYQVNFPKNDHLRFRAMCKTKECPFHAFVSKVGEKSTFWLKTLELKHTCARVCYNKKTKTRWVVKVLVDKFRTSERFTLTHIIQEIKPTYGIGITRSCAITTRKITSEQIEGNAMKQYSLLKRYNDEVRSRNENNTFKIYVNKPILTMPPLFWSIYMCLTACKKGFVEGCKPFIGVDGCHHGPNMVDSCL